MGWSNKRGVGAGVFTVAVAVVAGGCGFSSVTSRDEPFERHVRQWSEDRRTEPVVNVRASSNDGVLRVSALRSRRCWTTTYDSYEVGTRRVRTPHKLGLDYGLGAVGVAGGAAAMGVSTTLSSEPDPDSDVKTSDQTIAIGTGVALAAVGTTLLIKGIMTSVASADEEVDVEKERRETHSDKEACDVHPLAGREAILHLEDDPVRLGVTSERGRLAVEPGSLEASTVARIAEAEQQSALVIVSGNSDEVDLTRWGQALHRWAFLKAVERGTEEALEHFIGSHPSAPKRDDARALLASLLWEKGLSESKAVDALVAFSERFPQKPEGREARVRAAGIAWAALEGSRDPEQHVAFAERYPDSPERDEALERGAKLEWRSLRRSNDLEALEAFVSRYESVEEYVAKGKARHELVQGRQIRRAARATRDLSELEKLYRSSSGETRRYVVQRIKRLTAREQRVLAKAEGLIDNRRWSQYKIHPCRLRGGLLIYEAEMTGLGAANALLGGVGKHLEGFAKAKRKLNRLFRSRISGVKKARSTPHCSKPWYLKL